MLDFCVLARGLYRPGQLSTTYDSARHLILSEEQHIWMEQFWQEKLRQAQQQQYLLFDAPLYRLNAVTQHEQQLHLDLGNTSYKEYVTTRSPEFSHGKSSAELSNALSVCSVVETSDGVILLDKRQGVDVYVGRYHVIGGFFERGRDTTLTQQPDPFAAIKREIQEETGILEADIREQYCLGVVYDLETPHSELCFLTQLHIPLAEVQQRTPEDNEIKQLHPLQVTSENLRQFILTHHGNISATGEPNLLFYGAQKYGENWYQNLLQHLTHP
jgi:8-oxo-dGTP pyrophosphatase MutT (NUDIX family)